MDYQGDFVPVKLVFDRPCITYTRSVKQSKGMVDQQELDMRRQGLNRNRKIDK